jgi:hypothetical protein
MPRSRGRGTIPVVEPSAVGMQVNLGIALDWSGATSGMPLPANQYQLVGVSGSEPVPYEFILTFGFAAPTMVQPGDAPALTVPVSPVARIILSPARLAELASLLSQAVVLMQTQPPTAPPSVVESEGPAV